MAWKETPNQIKIHTKEMNLFLSCVNIDVKQGSLALGENPCKGRKSKTLKKQLHYLFQETVIIHR